MQQADQLPTSVVSPLEAETTVDAGQLKDGKPALKPTLTIVVPTFNERENIEPLIECLQRALTGVDWEVLFVDDDSPDGTHQAVQEFCEHNPRVRLLRRIGRRGLSSACIEGFLACSSPFVAVIDADMQHDERCLVEMLRPLQNEEADLVIGTRYASGGSTGELASNRVLISKLSSLAGKLLLKHDVSDPMSGFFMLNRKSMESVIHDLSGVGFKILIDILSSSSKTLRVLEVPYQMRARTRGDSKLDALVALEYLSLLLEKTLGRYIPVRFLSFVSVGAIGVLVHVFTLWFAHIHLGNDFVLSQSLAILVAMLNNFLLNNIFTHRERQLKGWQLLGGFASFSLACSIGALFNVQFASFIFEHSQVWWLSGILGATVGSIWNYAMTAKFTWKH
ncbi:glycosyltransferase family 2 protein [Pseudomaricurvus alkylphenolicus]|uniref:glycosyltransferase n=1 Tax=Pseudomaricurvus alkylphenolicus TaxID=1306991 RepID=UPI00141E9506|nr:glycosyltransferase family 2 protein [Pseudomaricurvus alkylphenolicus]NIB40020.1 glycosyltransferase family 2 protein [Pseudomaricurvus alkylphenolicus]